MCIILIIGGPVFFNSYKDVCTYLTTQIYDGTCIPPINSHCTFTYMQCHVNMYGVTLAIKAPKIMMSFQSWSPVPPSRLSPIHYQWPYHNNMNYN